MVRFSLRNFLLSSPAAILLISFQGERVHAQSVGATSEVPEIIVTAERRSQNLQNAPLAVTVRDGRTLVSQGRTSLAQIIEDVPSVNFRPNSGAVAHSDTASVSVSIRGIGSNDATSYTSVVPAVAQYVDDVVGGLGGDYDLDRVEVLRGPQGTLYGRSATAGVLNIFTREPTQQVSAELVGELGNYDLRRIWGAVNLPVTSEIALRVSGQHLERDGYYSEGGDFKTDSIRLKGAITPADYVSISLGAALEKNTFYSGGTQVNVTPQGVDFNSTAPLGKGGDTRKQVWGKIDWDFGAARLTYIPAFRTYRKQETSYSIFSGATLLSDTNEFSRDSFHTQELRLTSLGSGPFNWQAGLFYYDNDIEVSYDLIAEGGLFPEAYALQSGSKTKRTRNVGIFGEASYVLSANTRLTAGLRYDRTDLDIEEEDCSGPVAGSQTCLTVTGDEGKRSWNNITYKVRVEHDLTANNLIYGSISTAFLPGDVTVLTDSVGALMVAPYQPETLTSYEIGSKNRFLDGRLQINAALYHYRYGGYQQKIQVGEFMGVALNAIGNSPARVWGGEAEAILRLSPADRIDVNAAYIDAYYVNKPADFAAAVAQKDIPGIVPFEVTGAYSHDFSLGQDRLLAFKFEANYRSGLDLSTLTVQQAASSEIGDLVHQKRVLIGNVYASLRLSPAVSINAYVRNVSNNRYKTTVNPNSDSTVLAAQLFEPRTVGTVLNLRF